MSVPKGKQAEGKLLVNELARDLAVYTLRITRNTKVFDEKYQSAITNEILHSAIVIHKYAFSANNITVKSHQQYADRRHFQELAAVECNNLLSLIDLAKPLFHLSAKRCRYWGNLVIEVRNKIRAWIESDAKRYQEYR